MSRTARWSAAFAVVALVGLPTAVLGQDVPRRELDREAWTPPISNWILGGAVIGALASVHLDLTEGLDGSIHPQKRGESSLIRKIPRGFGSNTFQVPAAAAVILVGGLADNARMALVGRRLLQTTVIAGTASLALKAGVGRSRPGFGRDLDTFDAFTPSREYWSFPSGHATTMFAVATVLTQELGGTSPWVPWVAYPVAAWVAASRVMDERHWPTDVLAGAALGILSAQVWRAIKRSPVGTSISPGAWSNPGGGVFVGVNLALGPGGSE